MGAKFAGEGGVHQVQAQQGVGQRQGDHQHPGRQQQGPAPDQQAQARHAGDNADDVTRQEKVDQRQQARPAPGPVAELFRHQAKKADEGDQLRPAHAVGAKVFIREIVAVGEAQGKPQGEEMVKAEPGHQDVEQPHHLGRLGGGEAHRRAGQEQQGGQDQGYLQPQGGDRDPRPLQIEGEGEPHQPAHQHHQGGAAQAS